MLKRASAILCSSDIHEINHTGDDRGFISMSFLHDRRGIDSEKNCNKKVNLCSTLFALQFFHTAIFHQFTVQQFSKQKAVFKTKGSFGFKSISALFFHEFLNPFLNHCKCLASIDSCANSETNKAAVEEGKQDHQKIQIDYQTSPSLSSISWFLKNTSDILVIFRIPSI